MRDLCRSADPPAELRVVYAPTNADIVGARTPTVDYALELERICDDLALLYFDPSSAFREAWDAAEPHETVGEPLFFSRDMHWTADGHEVIGRLLFENLDWPDDPEDALPRSR